MFVPIDDLGCSLLYKTRELAELYVEQSAPVDPSLKLDVQAISSIAELSSFLNGLPAACSTIAWDITTNSQAFKACTVQELLDAIG